MMIPCLCSFTALRTLVAELVGARPLHLLTQTVLLLSQTQTSCKQKNVPAPFLTEKGSGTYCLVEN